MQKFYRYFILSFLVLWKFEFYLAEGFVGNPAFFCIVAFILNESGQVVIQQC